MRSPSLEWGAQLWKGEPISGNQVRNIKQRSSCQLPGALAAACNIAFLGAVFILVLAWELGVCPHSGRSCGLKAEAGQPLTGPWPLGNECIWMCSSMQRVCSLIVGGKWPVSFLTRQHLIAGAITMQGLRLLIWGLSARSVGSRVCGSSWDLLSGKLCYICTLIYMYRARKVPQTQLLTDLKDRDIMTKCVMTVKCQWWWTWVAKAKLQWHPSTPLP